MSPPSETLHPIAQELNRKLEAAAPEVFAMLSALGRRLYFPKGILSQGAEAKAKARRMNATIGIATENRAPMRLPSLERHLADLDAGEAVDYAPPAGRPGLRERWREKLLAENPSRAASASVFRSPRRRSRTGSRWPASCSSTRATACCSRTSSGRTTGCSTR